MPYQPPWTGTQNVDSIKNDLGRKVNGYGIRELTRRVDSMEYSMRELSALLDSLLSQLQIQEDKIRTLEASHRRGGGEKNEQH